MKLKSIYSRINQTLIALCLLVGSANAQAKDSIANDELYNEIQLQDSLLFGAFNTRNIDVFKEYFDEDLEFFHDKGGLTNYEHTVNFLKSTAVQDNHLKRTLIKESLEVYPIPGYGAMEIGEHRFCHFENGKEECGTFKFVQIWKQSDKKWKITKVISYGH